MFTCHASLDETDTTVTSKSINEFEAESNKRIGFLKQEGLSYGYKLQWEIFPDKHA